MCIFFENLTALRSNSMHTVFCFSFIFWNSACGSVGSAFVSQPQLRVRIPLESLLVFFWQGRFMLTAVRAVVRSPGKAAPLGFHAFNHIDSTELPFSGFMTAISAGVT